jgi:hypothetical protein
MTLADVNARRFRRSGKFAIAALRQESCPKMTP